jgi:hypothetical protein
LTTSDQFDREARFSPNGRSLAFVRGRNNATTLCTLIVDAQMRVTGDTVRVIVNRLNLRSPQWMGSGAELVFTAGLVGGGYIERVPATGGRSRRVMTIDAPDGIAVSARTNRLLISRNTSDVDIFRTDLSGRYKGGVGRARGRVFEVRRVPRVLAER